MKQDEVKPGEAGEPTTKEDSVSQRYWDRQEEATSEFKGEWWYSGDMVRVNEEIYLRIVGIKKGAEG